MLNLKAHILVFALCAFTCASSEVLHPDLPGVEVIEKRSGETSHFSLRNPHKCELTVSLSFYLENLTPSVRLPIELVLPPEFTSAELVVLRPTHPEERWQYRWLSHFSWGSPKAEHAPGQLYLLPFAPGRAFRVVQGQDGRFSHSGEDRFAVDFGLPLGTPVFAARDGLVVLVRDGFEVGAPDPSYKTKANEIFIRHEDGTLGEYVHLQKDGMSVAVGNRVHAGQALGLSGNSGYSQGPHLHFMVFRAKDSQTRESLPIQFNTKEGSGVTLRQGKTYTAVEPAPVASVATP